MKRNQCKLIKILNSCLIFLCFFSSIFAQNEAECEKVVEVVFEACNKKSESQLLPYLAESFSIAGYKDDMAKTILKQLISAVGNIVSYEKKKAVWKPINLF